MSDLSSFMDGPQLSLDDFKTEQSQTTPVVNDVSIKNAAAHAVALGGPTASNLNTYDTVNSEMATGGVSQLFDQITQGMAVRDQGLAKQSLANILLDPKISDDVKKRASQEVLDLSKPAYQPQNLVSRQAAQAPLRDETPEQSGVRISVAATFQRMNDIKRAQQAIYNNLVVQHNPDLASKAAGILGSLVPLSTGATQERILGKFIPDAPWWEKAWSVLQPGYAKQKIIDHLQQLPPDQQVAAFKNLADITASSSGIIAQTPNDFNTLNLISQYANGDTYGEDGKFWDNVFGALDFAVVAGALGKAGEAARAASLARQGDRIADLMGGFSEGVRATPGTELGAASAVPGSKAGRFSDETLDEDMAAWRAQNKDNVERDMTKGNAQPASVSQNVKDINPEHFRLTYQATVQDPSDETAQATHGTSRSDAVVSDAAPEVGHSDGSVNAKVSEPAFSPENQLDPDIAEWVNNDGFTALEASEKARTGARIVNDFSNAMTLSPRTEMFQISSLEHTEFPEGVNIKAVYGPLETGYLDYDQAKALSQWGLRNWGVKPEEITILKREGSQLVPYGASGGGPKEPGEYFVQVNHNYRFHPMDVQDWYQTTTKRDFFDRAPPITQGTHGSLTQHLFPAGSVQDPLVSLSALTTADKAAGLEKLLLQPMKAFNKSLKGVTKERYGNLISKINDMNLKEYSPSRSDLRAEGFQPNEIEALQHWRKLWDNVWWLENRDKVKSLMTRGYQLFVNKEGGTYLHARPINRAGDVPKNVEVVYPVTGEHRVLNPDEVKMIYDKGGKIAKTEDPIKLGDDFIHHIVSPETPDAYLRTLTPSDIVLHYKKGYYHVSYDGPYFIDRVWPGKGGKPDTIKTVGTASNKADADLMASRLDGTVDDSHHVVRLDKNLNSSSRAKTVWDLQSASGRSAQRYRGKRLEDATSNALDPSQSNIMSPVESAVKAIRSIATRTSVRDWLDTTKSRYMNNNADYLPKGEFNQPVFPANKKDIAIQPGKRGTQKGLAKARAEFDYIRAMENGYINSIDNFWKDGLNTIANVLGEHHITVGEKAARGLAKTGLTGEVRKLSFGLFLALNPLRQVIVQSHQAMLLASLNPKWFVTRAAPTMVYLIARQVGMPHSVIPTEAFRAMGMSPDEANKMYDRLQKSGLVAAVDKHSIVRGSLMDMADKMVSNSVHSVAHTALKPFKALGNFSRKVGFDAGEWYNIVAAWAAHYDLAMQKGADLSRSDVQAHIAALARNYTGSMNAAGDMPYNTNELSMFLQFQQQGHKMFSLVTTNRVLSRAQRLKLVGFMTVMYGIPPTLGAVLYDAITKDTDSNHDAATKAHIVDLLQRGAESATLNRIATSVSGEKTDIDFSSLGPLNMYGTGQLVHSLFTQSPGEALANTPSGSLLFGGNPRLTNFVKTTAKFFHLIDDNGNPVTFSQEVKAFAEMSSGLSNAFRAAYALKYGQTISSYSGRVTDPNVNTPEAIARLFGFPTWDAAQAAAENQELYDNSTKLENDVNTWYKNFRADMARDDITPDELEYIVRVHNKAFLKWGNNDKVSGLIERNLLRDAAKGDLTFYKRALDSVGIMNYQDWRRLVLDSPQIDEATKQQMLRIGDLYNPAKTKEDK